MIKKLAIVLAVLMLAVVAWGLLLEKSAVTIVVNGQPVSGPLKDVIGAGGLVVAVVALFARPFSWCLSSQELALSCWGFLFSAV